MDVKDLDADVLVADGAKKRGGQNARSDRAAVRLQRMTDYLEESLAKSNPLEASLGGVIFDLLLMARRLMQEFNGFLNSRSDSSEELELVQPSLDQYLRITKQIDRFTQLVVKLGAADKDG